MMIPEAPFDAETSSAVEWEGEGGALAPNRPPALPDEIIAITVTHYRVGPYTYTNLDDAMAQYRRSLKTDSASRT